MQQTFTKEFMEANCGCYKEEQLAQCSFMSDPTNITLEKIIKSEIPLNDKYWFVCKKLATKEENQQLAIRVAEIVLPIYENRYPEDKAPREAIEAAKQYSAGRISVEDLLEKRRVADATYAAAAYTAHATAHAAAGYAAYAAVYAAYAAYAAAAAYTAHAAAGYAADAAAGYAAHAAAYAVDAAVDAAAHAAHVAAHATAHAADAARAAYAVDAAGYAADDIKQQLHDYLLTFIK